MSNDHLTAALEPKEAHLPERIAPDQVTSGGTVRVAVMGGREQVLDWKPGLTVRDWLGLSNLNIERGQRVNVNGRQADLNDPIESGSVIVVTNKVANG